MLQAAMNSLQNGQFPQAETLSRQALAAGLDSNAARIVLALALHAQGKLTEALPEFRRLADEQPGVYEHWNNLGNVLRETRQYEEADAAYQRAWRLNAHNAGLCFNIGLNHLDAGYATLALTWLEKSHAMNPQDVEVCVYYASAAFDCAEMAFARKLALSIGDVSALDPRALGELSWLLHRVGSPDAGQDLLDRAVARYPDSALLRVRQAVLLERANRIEEARRMIDGLAAIEGLEPALAEDVAALDATLTRREGNLDYAQRMTEELVAKASNPKVLESLYFSLGRQLDAQGDAAGAMDVLERAHACQSEILTRKAPDLFRQGEEPLVLTRFPLTAAHLAGWPVQTDGPTRERSPVFVVGFPRSGTTLLETMLDAHSGLACMDERAFLQDALDSMSASGLMYPEDLGKLDAADHAAMRARYDKLVAECVTLSDGQRLVDKNPLNLLKLPLIRRLWPNAQIILALRHPCDVVLSNYMQHFVSPMFTVMCRTLESTARSYANALSFWHSQQSLLAADVLTVRYENLVVDVESNARRIVDFLQLPWEDAVVRVDEHARKRGFISTPSYTQVVQPVYSRSVERWRAYAPWFGEALPHLRPHAERYGYAIE